MEPVKLTDPFKQQRDRSLTSLNLILGVEMIQ